MYCAPENGSDDKFSFKPIVTFVIIFVMGFVLILLSHLSH